MNKLYFGDNLEILREIDDERVNLICTDPPFNSGRDYNAFIDDSVAQEEGVHRYLDMGHSRTRRARRYRTTRLYQ